MTRPADRDDVRERVRAALRDRQEVMNLQAIAAGTAADAAPAVAP